MNGYDEHNVTGTATAAPTEESVAQLLKDLRDESMILVRQQIELAKTETSEKISNISRNSISLSAGALVGYAGFLFLLTALNFLGVWGLMEAGVSRDIAMWVMPLIIGAVVGIIGYVLSKKAIDSFKHTTVVPEKTVHSLKEDRQWLAKKRQ